MRQIHGEDATEQWLRGMLANDVVEYPKNSPIVQAVGDGEVDIGLVNHYYLFRFIADNPDFPATNHFTDPGAAGGLVNVAGVAVLKSSRNSESALRFVRFLLSEEGQTLLPRPDQRIPGHRRRRRPTGTGLPLAAQPALARPHLALRPRRHDPAAPGGRRAALSGGRLGDRSHYLSAPRIHVIPAPAISVIPALAAGISADLSKTCIFCNLVYKLRACPENATAHARN